MTVRAPTQAPRTGDSPDNFLRTRAFDNPAGPTTSTANSGSSSSVSRHRPGLCSAEVPSDWNALSMDVCGHYARIVRHRRAFLWHASSQYIGDECLGVEG